MFNYTKAEMAQKAMEMNFIRDTLEKVFRLAAILDYINSNPIMKNVLALKGGTAINLTVFELPRLSVDIDLDYCSDESREDMLEKRKLISNDIKTYMATQGYSLNPQSKNRHSLDSFVYTYQNLGGMRDNIKIEINYSLRSHLFEPALRPVLTNAIQTEQPIYSLIPLELFAAKINALLSRAATRDLYDTYNMIQFGLFKDSDVDMLRKSVVFYTAVSQETITEEYSIKAIDTITSRKIVRDLVPVLQKSEFVELEQVKTVVKDYLERLLVLTEDERKFLKLFAHKEYHPELIFADEAILGRIKNHPMVLWKMQNH